MKVKSQKSKVKSREDYYLVLDPGASDGTLGFFVLNKQGGIVINYKFRRDSKSIEKLLVAIERKLMGVRLTLRDVKGVAVVEGGESFSLVRGAHAVTNSLGWSLGIPTMRVSKSLSHKVIESALGALKRLKKFHLLIPEYTKEPNITLK